MADFTLYFPIENVLEGTHYEDPANDQCNKFGLEVSDLNTYYQTEDKTCADVAKLTSHTAALIIKSLYWDFFLADDINDQQLAMFIVDSGLNEGTGLIAHAVQEIVGVTADGIPGTHTLKAINNFNAFELYCKLYGYRLRRYDEIVSENDDEQEFYTGWINRLNTVSFIPKV